MNATRLETMYFEGQDGTLYQVIIVESGSYTHYVERKGLKYAGGYLEKLSKVRLFSYEREATYDQAKPSSPQKWLDILSLPNVKWVDEKRWNKIFEGIPALPLPPGVSVPKLLEKKSLRDVTRDALTHEDKYVRKRSLEAVFQFWGEKAEPAIIMCQRVLKSAVAFSILMYGLKWNVRGLESFARTILTRGSTKLPWIKSTVAIQFYAAAYLEGIGKQDLDVFPQRVQFLYDLIQFLFKSSDSPDKAKDFASTSPQRAREVAKFLYAQNRYAALKCWCIGALQAGVTDGLVWKLLSEACKRTKILGKSPKMIKKIIGECEKNADNLGYVKAEVEALQAISKQAGAEGDEEDEDLDADVDQDDFPDDEDEGADIQDDDDGQDDDVDEDESDDADEEENVEIDVDSDNPDDDEQEGDEDNRGGEEDEGSDEDEGGEESDNNDAHEDNGKADENERGLKVSGPNDVQAIEVAEKKRREGPGQPITELFPQASGTDILVEFFTGEGIKRRGYRGKYYLPNQEMLPWVVQRLGEPLKAEFLQKYLARLVAILKGDQFRAASIGGAFRVALKLAELLKVPEVMGLYAILLDKYFVQMGSTGYLARRVVRTWKVWAKEHPESFVRALTPFLSYYPPVEPIFLKDQAKLVRTPFEPVKVHPPPPELLANVKDLLNQFKPDAEEAEKIELLRQVLNFGDTVEGLLNMARVVPRWEAGKYLQKAISLNQTNLQIWLEAAELAQGRDKLKYLFGALERNPNNSAVYFTLGNTLAERGMSGKRLIYLKKAIELAPTKIEYLVGLAEALREEGQLGEAVDVLKHVLLLEPKDIKTWELLAQCYNESGASPEALFCVEKVRQAGRELPEEIAKSANEWKKQKVQAKDPLQGMPKDARLKVGTPELPGKFILVRFLLGNSKRLVQRYRQIRAGHTSILAEEAWRTREEIFPEIWDNHPEEVWAILQQAQNIVIRDFCLRVLSQSPNGQAFLVKLGIGQLVFAVRVQHSHTQDMLLPLIKQRLQEMPEVPQEIFELLVQLEATQAWDLAVDLLEAKKLAWTPRNLALILAKPTTRVKDFCQNNVQQVKAVQDDVVQEYLQLVAKGDVPWEAIWFVFVEFKLTIPTGGLTPLFQSTREVAQNILLELLSKWNPAERKLSAEELAAGLRHPEKNVRQQALRYLRAQLGRPSPALQDQVAGLLSIIWATNKDVIDQFPRLLDEFIAQNPSQIHLLLEHLVDQGAKRGVETAQEKTFFEVVSRVPLEAWKNIDAKWVEDVVIGAGDDVRALGGLIAAYAANRAIIPAIVPLIAKSEQGILRCLLVDNLTKFPDLVANQPQLLLVIIESDFDDLFAWGSLVIKDRGLPKETTAPISEVFRELLDSPVLRVRDFAFTFLSEKFEGNLPIDVVLRLLEHPAIDIRQRLAGAIGHYLERIVQQDPQLAFRYAKSIILVPNKIANAKDHVYRFLVDFANTAPKYRNSIKELLLKIGAGSIIKDRERALAAYVKIQE